MTLAEVEAKYPGQPCFAMSLHDAACVLLKGHLLLAKDFWH